MVGWWTVLALAVSLAADAGAVAIATAIRARQVPLGGGLAFAGWCGFFSGAYVRYRLRSGAERRAMVGGD